MQKSGTVNSETKAKLHVAPSWVWEKMERLLK